MMDTRICTKCKIEKSLDEFHVNKRVVCDGHTSVCKQCKSLVSKKAYKNDPHPDFINSPPPLDAKQKCIDCGKVKSLYNDFHSNKRNKNGHFNLCKECRAKHKQKYMRNNIEKIAASNHEYAKTHKAEIYQRQKEYKSKNKVALAERDRLYRIRTKVHKAEYSHEYGIANREACSARANRWKRNNKEKVAAISRRYAKNHPDRIVKYRKKHYYKNRVRIRAKRSKYHRDHPWVGAANTCKRRHAEKLRTPTYADLDKIKMVYRTAHIMSSITGIKYHVDHDHPLRGKKISGFHIETNLMVVTASENMAKRNYFTPKFIRINCPFIKYSPGEEIYQLP